MARDDRAPGARLGEADLMLIAGIDRVTAERLLLLGLSSFAEMAAWTADDVRRWRDRLGLDNRISTGCWIEQASLLARGIETSYAARVRSGAIATLVRRPKPEPPPLPRDFPGFSPKPSGRTSDKPAVGSPPGTLMRRLGRVATATTAAPPLRQSAMGPIEEATVEIMRHDPVEKKPS